MHIEITTPFGKYLTKDSYSTAVADADLLTTINPVQLENGDTLLLGSDLIKQSSFLWIKGETDTAEIAEETDTTETMKPGKLAAAYKDQVHEALVLSGSLNAFEVQKLFPALNAPAIRKIFGDMEEKGLVRKEGQKRGTRYIYAKA